MTVSTTQAQAFTCSQAFDREAVVDVANVLSSQNSQIRDLVNQLQQKDADVRVRTLNGIPANAGNLERFVVDPSRGVLASCPSWQGVPAKGSMTMKSNLIALVVSVDNSGADVYLGNGTDLDARGLTANTRNSIRAQKIQAAITSRASIGTAVTAGLTEINNVLRGPAAAKPAAAPAAPKAQQPLPAAATPNIRATDNPQNSSGAGTVLIVIGIILFVGIAAGLGYLYWDKRKKHKEAHEAASMSYRKANENLNNASEAVSLAQTVELLSGVSAARMLILSSAYHELAMRKSQVFNQMQGIAHLPDDPSLSLMVLNRLEKAYDEVSEVSVNLLRDANILIADVERLKINPEAPLMGKYSKEESRNYDPEKSTERSTRVVETPEPRRRRVEREVVETTTHTEVRSEEEPRRFIGVLPVTVNPYFDRSRYLKMTRMTQIVIQRADAAIGRAEHYIKSYEPWVGQEARYQLHSAMAELEGAFNEHYSSDQRRRANEARILAERSLRNAKYDVTQGRDYRSEPWYPYYTWHAWYPPNTSVMVLPYPNAYYSSPVDIYGGYGTYVPGPVYIQPDGSVLDIPAQPEASDLDGRGNSGRVEFRDNAAPEVEAVPDVTNLDDRGNSGRVTFSETEPVNVVSYSAPEPEPALAASWSRDDSDDNASSSYESSSDSGSDSSSDSGGSSSD